MATPMVGTWTVRVQTCRPFLIHGDVYYEVQVLRLDDPAAATAAVLRMPQHVVREMPREGETLRLTFLMGQVTEARPLAT